MLNIVIAVRNEVAKVMFLHVSVILSTGGGAWSGEVPGPGGSAWGGVSAPRGCLVQGGLLRRVACTEADPPRERRLLLRTVRILLECILVYLLIVFVHLCLPTLFH